jgi:hypothetical protein
MESSIRRFLIEHYYPIALSERGEEWGRQFASPVENSGIFLRYQVWNTGMKRGIPIDSDQISALQNYVRKVKVGKLHVDATDNNEAMAKLYSIAEGTVRKREPKSILA